MFCVHWYKSKKLLWAFKTNSEDEVSRILSESYKSNKTYYYTRVLDDEKNRTIHYCGKYGMNLVLELISSHLKCELFERNGHYQNILHILCIGNEKQYQKRSSINFLLKKGKEIFKNEEFIKIASSLDDFGYSPLHYCILSNNLEILKLLKSSGCSIYDVMQSNKNREQKMV